MQDKRRRVAKTCCLRKVGHINKPVAQRLGTDSRGRNDGELNFVKPTRLAILVVRLHPHSQKLTVGLQTLDLIQALSLIHI